MEVILILVLLFLVLVIFVIVWIFKSRKRTKYALFFGGGIVFFLLVHDIFLVDHEMKFIQSKVYPDLYLIKNGINDGDSLNRIIKKMVTEKIKREFIGNENKYKHKYEYTGGSRTDIDYDLDFYTYFEGWGTNPFGEAGTAHFIEKKEDPGGFSSEELDHYGKYRIASFYIRFCEKDTVNYMGILQYYRNGENIKSDTLINTCNN